MALVSPGVSISINDQSQYVNSNVGSVPLVVLATAENKTNPSGSVATGTTKANAGKLLAFTSQRDLITQMGAPSFQVGASGTPVNGSAVNEYGLLAAYSALGLSNQLFAIRADINLTELAGTSIRPTGSPADGTYWLDIDTTSFGINVFNETTQSYTDISSSILEITNYNQVQAITVNGTPNVPVPLNSVGQIGQYAIPFTVAAFERTPTNLRLFYKKGGATSLPGGTYHGDTFINSNTWTEVGSPDWQVSFPTMIGTVSNGTLSIPQGSTATINNVTLVSTPSAMTVTQFAGYINSASIPGVYAAANPATNQLMIFATSSATSDGSHPDGKVIVVDGTNNPLYLTGIVSTFPTATAIKFAPQVNYGNFANGPLYNNGQHPTGSMWFKIGAIGNGWDPVLSRFNGALGQFERVATPAFSSLGDAIYGLDPAGGGINITHGQVITTYNATDLTYNSLRFWVQVNASQAIATSGTPGTITPTQQITVQATHPGSNTFISYLVTMSGSTATTFVTDLLSANIPYVSAQVNDNGTITITHTTGGQINMNNVSSGRVLSDAGFVTGEGSGFTVNASTGSVNIGNWTNITPTIISQVSAPYESPESGTYWYYSNPADLDIMINTVNGWQGYRTTAFDARGFNLQQTDPNGVIITPSKAPTSHSDGTPLVKGDLWLDSADLMNYPKLSRCVNVDNTGLGTWEAIDNTDHISQNGIIFADARWGDPAIQAVNPITDPLPSTVALLNSNYIDLDAPDWRLYPIGTLLFNTRRSGYNVKKFVKNYFNSLSFPPAAVGNIQHFPTATPAVEDAWVSASGLDSNGVMHAGTAAQRALIVSAMQSAVDSNLDALNENFKFNLVCAPGFPELIPNMLTLNTNRGNTAFVIGDTPMDLAPNVVDITNWVDNTSGNGLPSDASASPYMALYYPAGITNDLSGNQVVVPASHAVLRTFLYNDQVSYPWFAPAGVNRGLISNLSDIGYLNSAGTFVPNAVSQGLRDALFTLSINPLTQLPGTGLVVFGQMTRSLDTTAQNRVNVVRLENYLRTIFSSISNGYLFEPNDAITRKSIATSIENALNNVLAHRGLYDFLVICDTSNNTPATISNNQLYVDVAIEPMKDVEFIYIPIAIYNPGTIASLNTQST